MLTIRHKKIIKHLVISKVGYQCNIMHIFDIDLNHSTYEGSFYETMFYILNDFSLSVSKLEDLKYMKELTEDYDNLLKECIEILNNIFKNSIDKLI